MSIYVSYWLIKPFRRSRSSLNFNIEDRGRRIGSSASKIPADQMHFYRPIVLRARGASPLPSQEHAPWASVTRYLLVGEARVGLHGLERGGVVGLAVQQQARGGGARARAARAGRGGRHAEPRPRARRRVQRARAAAAARPARPARHSRAHRLRHLVHRLHVRQEVLVWNVTTRHVNVVCRSCEESVVASYPGSHWWNVLQETIVQSLTFDKTPHCFHAVSI